MKVMIASAQWQAMTPAERERITQQATQGHMTLEDIGKMAACANVNTVVLSHYLPRADGNYTPWVSEVKKHLLVRFGCTRLDGILADPDIPWRVTVGTRIAPRPRTDPGVRC
jgi:hypothetical protein